MPHIIELVLLVGAIHFLVPLGYYAYLKRLVNRTWNLALDTGYTPRTTVVIPTFDESAIIEARLDNIKAQSMPKEKLDVVVIDSGSRDRTSEIVDEWRLKNHDLKVSLITEPTRRGKAEALNVALQATVSDIVVLTDADAMWTEEALRKAIYYFSDRRVGAVTGVKEPVSVVPEKRGKLESVYRRFYNVVRVGESKIHSTPIFNGELAAFKTDQLKAIGGFQGKIGADDSHAATLLALKGFRAIAVPEVVVFELAPKSWLGYLKWKKRRALHLLQHFRIVTSKLGTAPRELRKILLTEAFLHILNPWLLLAALAGYALSIVVEGLSIYHLAIGMLFGTTVLSERTRDPARTWFVEQLILAYAAVNSLFTSELVWPKIDELRTTASQATAKR